MEPSRCRSPNFGGYVGALSALSAATLMLAVIVGMPNRAKADEGGVSFWLPGQFGSLAAAPLTPGLTVTEIYYHANVAGGGDVATARAITIRQFTPTLTENFNGSIHGAADLVFGTATYVFATPVLGGQASLGMGAAYGRNDADLNATISGSLGPIPFSRTFNIEQATVGFSDLYPMATLRWNNGVHNYMTYVTGDIPVGLYSSSNLANMGIGHGAVDAGGGYTYFDPKTGHEFSVVSGLTYNFINPSTQYQNGIDWHLDWGASQFINKAVHVGAVGYFYNEIGCDSGAGAKLGCFRSQVIGIGPQFGVIFPMQTAIGPMQGYLNLKGYGEFDHHDRAAGWNAWITLSISPATETPPASAQPTLVHK
jgi:hypothetical protein